MRFGLDIKRIGIVIDLYQKC